MIYRFKSNLVKEYIRDFKKLEDALEEFPELDEDEDPAEYGEIFAIEEGKTKPSMVYLPHEGVWKWLNENKND